jgi:Zn-dependent protease
MPAVDESNAVETPILNSGGLPNRVRKRTRGATLIAAIVGCFVGIIMIEVVGVQASGGLDNAYGWLISAAALLLSIIIHELGHLSAGWFLGFRFSLISIGPFCLRLEHGRLKVSLLREMTALGYAGMHIDNVRRLRRRLLLYALAGPVAGLLLVPVGVLFANHSSFADTHPWSLSFAAEFVMLSVLLSTTSLIPLGRNSSNDGSRIAMLLGDYERTRRLISFAAIAAQHEKGVRPRNWRLTWLSAATSTPDESVQDWAGNWFAYISFLDREDERAAGLHLEKCLSSSRLFTHSVRDLAAQEAAVFSAWVRGNPVLADKWLGQVKRPKLIPPLQQIRIKVAICSGCSDFQAALEAWQQGLTLIERLSPGPGREALREGWLEWSEEIEERQNAVGTA